MIALFFFLMVVFFIAVIAICKNARQLDDAELEEFDRQLMRKYLERSNKK